MLELVQSFNFRVQLTRASSPGPTHTAPPELRGEANQPGPGAGDVGGAVEQLSDGGFQECTGLDVEADIKEYLEGGRNDGVVRRIGRVKLSPITLKRGIFMTSTGGYADTRLWQWLQAVVNGTLPLPRYDGSIEVLDSRGQQVTARWTFQRALPTKVTGPQLNAKTGEIVIEELQLAHEGLRMEVAP
jgi:phage tail-like protein